VTTVTSDDDAGRVVARAIGVALVIGTCRRWFTKGTAITLTAAPAAGRTFRPK